MPYIRFASKRVRYILTLLSLICLLGGCSWQPWEREVAGVTATPQSELSTPLPQPTAGTASSSTPTPLPVPTSATATDVRPTPTFEPIEPTPTLAPIDAEARRQIFERTWMIVRDRYVYEDFRGVDWEAVRTEFTPLIIAATTPERFYELMRGMIARLDDEHSRFESPQQVAAQQAEFRGRLRYGGIGALIRTIEEGGLVLNLAPDGPAERAGVQLRDVILAIDGIPFTDRTAFGPDGPIGAVRGEPGTPVRLTVRTANNPPRELTLLREAIASEAFNRVRGRLLPLDRDIGLIEIPSFYVEELDTRVREKVEELRASGELRGLIIDVRGNSGGYVHLMRNTIALFHDGGSIGSTSGRNQREEQIIPRGQQIAALDGLPIAVLIDADTVSAGEMFAAGMQVLGRAVIVGVPSAGNTENLYSYDFDDGSRLLIAEVAYRLPDSTLIEDRGVIPDRIVESEWWRFNPDDDPQLRAALEELAQAMVITPGR